MKILIHLIVLLITCKSALGSESVVVVTPEIDEIRVGKSINYFVDSSSLLTIEDVSASDSKIQWTPSSSVTPNLGFTTQAVWVRLELRFPKQTSEKYVIELLYPHHRSIEYFYQSGSSVYSKVEAGTKYQFDRRPILFKNFVFPLEIQAKERAIVYFRFKSETSKRLDMTVMKNEMFQKQKHLSGIMSGLFYGASGMMILFNLAMWLGSRNSAQLQYILAISSSLLFHVTFSGEGFAFIWPFSTDWQLRSVPFSILVLNFTGTRFASSFLGAKECSPRLAAILKLVGWTAATLAPMSFVLPYYSTIVIAMVFTILSCISVVSTSVHCLRYGDRLMGLYFIGAFSTFLLAAALAVIENAGLYHSNIWMKSGLQLSSLLEKVTLTFGFGHFIKRERDSYNRNLHVSNEKLTILNNNLSEIVEEKTKEVVDILDNIPLGIFCIDKQLSISGKYSEYLKLILDYDELPKTDIGSFLFERSDLDSDSRDSAIQTLKAIIGEEALSFELNVGNLPTTLCYFPPGREGKDLELLWGIKIKSEENNLVQEMLVTIRDVTQEKLLKKQVAINAIKIKRLSELMACGINKFSTFTGSLLQFLLEVEKHPRSHQPDDSYISLAFVNLHTAKGEARTLGLSDLANSIHKAEDFLVPARKDVSTFQSQKFQETLLAVRATHEEYSRLSEQFWGNKAGKDERSGISLDSLRQIYQRLLRHKQKLPRDPMMAKDLDYALNDIAEFVSFDLEKILVQASTTAKKIASDLEKPCPRFVYDLASIRVDSRSAEALRFSLVHLLRNALDHGIEKPSERINKGKAEAGTLYFKSLLFGNLLTLQVRDDGRGLAIEKLLNQGVENDLVSSSATVTEIANLIFKSGNSTKDEVTEHSGRGVGMFAIKQFLEKVGGNISIHIMGESAYDKGFWLFRFDIVLPLFEVTIEENRVA